MHLDSGSHLITANEDLQPLKTQLEDCINMSLGISDMWLLINVILILWVSCSHGQVKLKQIQTLSLPYVYLSTFMCLYF